MDQSQQGRAMSLLFGPQATITHESMLGIRQALREHPGLNFLGTTIEELPALWLAIVDFCPILNSIPGRARLEELSRFIFDGADLAAVIESGSLPSKNTIMSPLTVISQIIDFWKHTHGLVTNSAAAIDPSLQFSSDVTDVQGFCLGFLTAISVSCSRSEAHFHSLASKAVRLALILGAWIDLDAFHHDEADSVSSAIAVRWRSETHWQHLQRIMESYPKAYISTRSDSTTATITIPNCDSAPFMAMLAQVNVPTMLLAPRGRWHNRHHLDGLRTLSKLCERDERFQFPDADALNSTLLSNINGEPITQGSLHHIALQSILTEQSRWDKMFDVWLHGKVEFGEFVMIGEKVMVPKPAITPLYPDVAATAITNTATSIVQEDDFPDSAVAIIGMSCRYPEADTLEEFWDLIKAGKCVIREFPKNRFDPAQLKREPKGPYWGGYVREPEMFDHRFFGVSGREAKSMDPQQRMSLAVAYEAMESAGYCGLRSSEFDREVGCYVGVANDDYDCNIASHPINAFSLTGSLRSFIAGRISHFFGWTGPSLTVDTACSAAAVAIHTACRALQAQDCSVALAGGVCAMTSSRMTQNLIGAGFLSPTGASKAFDVSADGYCRAEGAGMVVLRRLKDAVNHGDTILGVITGSAVNQGSNCSSITVPDSSSQLALYDRALGMSGILPTDISYVEAHGTGTQVGDPIEFKSIRETFGGVHRKDDVYVGSVKDNIGHTEASSGIASLLKTLLMLQKKTIPRQANFKLLNPKIPPLGKDHVVIPTQTSPWKATHRRKALINNYGASGNNAALVLQEATVSSSSGTIRSSSHLSIYISGKSTEAVQAYCRSLRSFLSDDTGLTLPDVAFNLAVKQNREFEHFLSLTTTSLHALSDQLESIASDVESSQIQSRSEKQRDPFIVLCFGGQDGKLAHISKSLYDSSILLQHHLAECELACTKELALPSVLFPVIFNSSPINDLVILNCALFSIQYACARSWLDAGLKPNRLVGHSFGQLTALCVAQSISLVEAVRLVATRARLLQTHCAPPRNGLMLAVEGKPTDVEHLLSVAEQGQTQDFSADIACYNGPQSLVVAGDEPSIQAVEAAASRLSETYRFRMKRLGNSHAFHSRLLDGVLPDLMQVAEQLRLKPPAFPIEACVSDDDDEDWSEVVTAKGITRHTREPVFFIDAVRRIEKHTNDASIVWLEAGSGSPIIPMIKRAVNRHDCHTYLAASLRSDASAEANLANTTCHLWSNGVRVQFWPFHSSQRSSFDWVNLPPYQFAKTRHWLEYQPGTIVWQETPGKEAGAKPTRDHDLVRLISEHGTRSNGNDILFEINPNHELYQLGTSGHEVVDQSLCPASMYCEFVLNASHMLLPDRTAFVPQISDLAMSSPLVLNPVGRVFLRFEVVQQLIVWDFTIYSNEGYASSSAKSKEIVHGTGRIAIVSGGSDTNSVLPSSTISSFRSLQAMILQRCRDIEESPMSIGYKGPTVYKAFRPVVTYVDYYRGIQSIYNLGQEAIAHITMPHARPLNMGKGVCDPVLIDSITQVSGVLANCFALGEGDPGEMWVCNFIGGIEMAQEFIDHAREQQHNWTAYGKYDTPTPKRLTCDIFVFEPQSGNIVFTIRSIEFQRVSIKSLTKVLSKLNTTNGTQKTLPFAPSSLPQSVQPASYSSQVKKSGSPATTRPFTTSTTTKSIEGTAEANPAKARSTLTDVELLGRGVETKPSTTAPRVEASSSPTSFAKIQEMLKDVLEIPIEHIKPDSHLESLGVDSLLATELFSEINKRFDVKLSHTEFATVSDVGGLARLVFKSIVPEPEDRNSRPTSSNSTSRTQSSSVKTTSTSHFTIDASSSRSSTSAASPSALTERETVTYGERDGVTLSADIYYPDNHVGLDKSLPIALMIHGGGHVMYTRNDIRDDQTQTLLCAGFLPISIDYRLCPEVSLQHGPMRDVCDALAWARTTLPNMSLPGRPDIRADGNKVVAVGWSSGGQLAMSLGWMAPSLGIRPPEAILAFYCPTDYEDRFWREPNRPFDVEPIPAPAPEALGYYDHLYEGLYDNPIVGYSPGASKRALGGWMSLEDARSRIVLHMNWEGQAMPVLINGLPKQRGLTALTTPSTKQIQEVSPLAQIRAGRYTTPTFFIHGTRDDLVPWQESQRTHEALLEKGVETQLEIVEGALHLFDMYRFKRNPHAIQAIQDGYEFLRAHVR